MRLSIIAALSPKGVIGYQNRLPWDLPDELRYFRQQTLNKPVIMGRKTFESIGRPLPNRKNIIVSTDKVFNMPEGCALVHSVTEALHLVQDTEEAMVIGGAKIYEAFLPFASRLYLSFVDMDVEGDTFFPAIRWEDWQLISEKKFECFTAKIYEKNLF